MTEPRDRGIHMKEEMFSYPQNQEEFIQQSSDKLPNFCRLFTLIGVCNIMDTLNQE